MGSIRPPADHPESKRMRSVAGVVTREGMNGVSVTVADRAHEPFDRVLTLDILRARTIFAIAALTLLVHGTAAARTLLIATDLIHFSDRIAAEVAQHLAETIDIETLKAPDVPPPPPPPPEPEPDKAPPPPPRAESEPPPPPPAAAAAGKVLTADPDPNEPVDLTNTIVTGNHDTYAGGVSAPSGTSNAAVYATNARPGGTPGGTGAPVAAPAPAVDKSRAASVGGSTDWRCPWPSEADAEQIDEAYAVVQVTVSAEGRATAVKVLNDPGHGFGREARGCAMRETFRTALDAWGRPIAGTTGPIKVHFER
jgi:protein TonB